MQAIRQLGKTRWRPAFCGPVGGASADSNTQRVEARTRLSKKLGCSPAVFLRNVQSDETFIRKRIDPACPANKLQVIKLFVWRNFPRLRNRNRFRQEKASAVARVADAFRNAGAPSQPRSVERIL